MLILHSQAHSSSPNCFTPGQSGSAGRALFDAAQKTFGFQDTLLGYVELLVHPHLQVLLLQASFNPFSSQSARVIAPAEVQNPPYSVCKGQRDGGRGNPAIITVKWRTSTTWLKEPLQVALQKLPSLAGNKCKHFFRKS